MLTRIVIILLALVGLTCWSENIPPKGAFIFIEEQPAFTSADPTAKSKSLYINDHGLIQHYACEDDKIKTIQESSLPVADVFKTLSGISFKTLPINPDPADARQPPSQAGPSHMRLMIRQPSGAEYMWAGATSLVPAALQKLVQEAWAFVVKLTASRPVGGAFVRADIMTADRLEEYRASPPAGGLITVKNLDDLGPVLKQSLLSPFRLIPVPPGTNPWSAFAVKGEASPLPLLYKETGYEVNRYSLLLSSGP